MISNLPMPVIICAAVALILVVLWSMGTFSARKQYRNKSRFSLEGAIQKNLVSLNANEVNNQASNKFHFDDRITGNVLDDGRRLDSLYAEKTYNGPYGISTRSAAGDDDTPVLASVNDVEPDTPVQVDSSQVDPAKQVVVKKEVVVPTEAVVVKAKDVKPGERVIVKPVKVKANQMVLKKSVVSGESELVAKENIDINEDVVADSSQINPDEEVVVSAAQVKPNKSVVAQGKSLSAGKVVVVNAIDVKSDTPVAVKVSDTKPSAVVKSIAPPAGTPQIGIPAASDGIEIESPEPISSGTLETRLAGDSRFGQVYSMNKYPTKKAYATVSTRQKLSEFPVRSTVHTSVI
tara:strand:- start:136 stop:1179 length:1044 start_codon:yes stop_codon:yes gene_type:complete